MDGFAPCLFPPPLPTEEDGSLSPSSVLLDNTAYITATAVSNSTTAVGVMSTGKPIQISFCLAHPPHLSYACVHFPGPASRLSITVPPGTAAVRCVKEAPQVISTHADLVLLRVTLPGTRDIGNPLFHNYFVYTARPRPGACSLDRLPHPRGANEVANFRDNEVAIFRDNEVAIFRCSGDASRYIIAGLRNTGDPNKFELQLYDSHTHSWTSTLLAVHAPVRDRVLPIPRTATELLFHDTTKVITLGGPRATIGWVDLWRGILLCDVLDEKPVLHDVPLPKPSRANRPSFCRGCPHTYRDIAVVALPGQHIEIKYIVMETRSGTDVQPSRPSVDTSDSGSDTYPDPDSDDDAESDLDVAPYWNATIWTLPVPIASWSWHKDKDYKVDVTDIVVDNPRHSELLLPLPRLRTDPENSTMSLRRLLTAHPTLGLGRDGDLVIYLLSKVDHMHNKGWVIAVGLKDKKLRDIAELDIRKNNLFMRYYHHTGISKYLIKATGEAGALVRPIYSSRRQAWSTNAAR